MLKNLFAGLAASDLGVGGTSAGSPDETEEQKQKRLQMKQMQAAMSPASKMLFGGGFTGRGGDGALAY